MLDPEQLRNFLHVVDTGSLSRASSLAHVTQPALSRQMSLLEDSVGVELFERTGRGMKPTSEGRRLEQRVRPLLRQLDSLTREFSEAPIGGPVSLAVSSSVGMSWTARLVDRFVALYPDAQLRVTVALSGAIGEAIALGKFDLGLFFSPVIQRDLVVANLWQESLFLVSKRQRGCQAPAHITTQDVLRCPLILPSSQFGIRALLEEQAQAMGEVVEPKLEVNSVQLALALVEQSAGHLVLTGRMVSDLRRTQFQAVPIVRPKLKRSAILAATSASLLRPVVRAFWELAIEEAAKPKGAT